VKTGTDADVGSVNMTPQDTTIFALTSLPRPSRLPPNNRAAPAEFQVWRLTDITLTVYKAETDSDYHLVLTDGSRTMIAEIAHPECIGGGSPFLSGSQTARTTFNGSYTPTSVFQTANVTASVIGAGFFDFFHGQRGVALNAIELHPLLGICFGAGCQIGGAPDDYSIGISPDSQSVTAPDSIDYIISTTVTSGNPQAVSLEAPDLPAGVSPVFNPPTINSGDSSTLTLTVSSDATAGTFIFTVIGTGPAATHSTTASLTINVAEPPSRR
jgi:hypothetical protein